MSSNLKSPFLRLLLTNPRLECLSKLVNTNTTLWVTRETVRDLYLKLKPTRIRLLLNCSRPNWLDNLLRENAFKRVKCSDHLTEAYYLRDNTSIWLTDSSDEDSKGRIVHLLAKSVHTIDATAFDLTNGDFFDPFGCIGDLKSKVLAYRHPKSAIGPDAIVHAAWLVSRFGLKPSSGMIDDSKGIHLSEIPGKATLFWLARILTESSCPSAAFEYLRKVKYISAWPELNRLVGCRQSEVEHPEGDVWTHTMIALDYFAKHRSGRKYDDLIVGLAVLLHDVGKPNTRRADGSEISFIGHASAARKDVIAFLQRLGTTMRVIEDVVELVQNHMRPLHLYLSRDEVSSSAISRLMNSVGNHTERLLRLVNADIAARPPIAPDYAPTDWLRMKIEAIKREERMPESIIKGRHLIEIGMQPGPEMGDLLNQLYQMQLNSKFSNLEGGLKAAEALLQKVADNESK